MRTGVGAVAGTNPSTLDYPGKSQPSPGFVVNLPGGKYNTVRISYFQTTSHQAGSTPTQALNFFGTDYAAGYAIDSGYSIKNVQLSWDYMTWPFPVEGSTFRLKTLWQIQATSIHTLIDGPYEVDSSGNSSPAASEQTNWFAYPSFGLAVEKIFSKNLRWEARGSGFGLPHRASIGDVESTINSATNRSNWSSAPESSISRQVPEKPNTCGPPCPARLSGCAGITQNEIR